MIEIKLTGYRAINPYTIRAHHNLEGNWSAYRGYVVDRIESFGVCERIGNSGYVRAIGDKE